MNKYKPEFSTGIGVALAASAIFSVAMSPVCRAQDAPAPAPARATVMDAAPVTGALGSSSREAADGKTLHVTVGHSIFVDTKTRLRRVYVADPTILNSVTLTPNEIIVTAMNPGVSSLTLLDESGQAQSYVVSADLDIDGLRMAMSQAMRGGSVKVEGTGARVTLSGTVATTAIHDDAVKLAGLYSKEVADALTVTPIHPKQVRLQVRILEVDRSKAIQQGINLFNPGGNTSFLAATTTSQFPSTATFSPSVGGSSIGTLAVTNPLNFSLYSAKLNLGATIQDLENKQILQILAEPTITTISGVKADFLSGGEFPFPMVQPGSNGGSPLITIQFRPYGVKVEFTPIVNEDGTVSLTVAPEVSALDYTNTITISGLTVPALSTRRASTQVELRSGQSFAISGLLDQRTTDILARTPGVASIPILGALFKSKNVNHSTTELVVVVTPTVVDPLTEMAVPSQPDLPIPPLKIDDYDKSLRKDRNPQPAAPPITPDRPPTVPPVFPHVAPTTAPAAGAVVNEPRPQDPQGVPASAASNQVTVAAATLATASTPMPASTTESLTPKAASLVEVMALSHESDAEAMVAALKRHGYNVAVNHDAQNSLLHLDIGPFASQKEAESMRQRLLRDGYNATIK